MELVPEGVEHSELHAALELVAAAGVLLDPWQEYVLAGSLLRDPVVDRWAAFAVGVCCPRQNGKNAVIEARELAGLFVLGERMIVHTAHQSDTAKEAFRRLADLIDANEWLAREVRHVWRTNGHEAIELHSGARIRFRTRTNMGGRGFSGDCVVFDEAMYLPESSMNSILPVVSARPNPQVWYTGSAVDQYEHEDGVVFARVRERALQGEDPRLAYFEWSLDAGVPDEVDEETASDPANWALANPALGIRIEPDYVDAEQRELGARGFAVERLGVGDWPPTEVTVVPVLDLERWDELASAADGAPRCLAFDVAPDQEWASICVERRGPDGLPLLELVARKFGARWLVGEVGRLAEELELELVVCGGSSPAEAFVPLLENAGVGVTVVNTSEHARACGLLASLVNAAGVRQVPHDGLRAALKGAARKPYGDAWLWSRKNSAVDISPLVAATLALWGASTLGWDLSGDPVIY